MNRKRILIVNIQSLLIGAAESLLKNNGDFAVINIYPKDMVTLIREIERARPDVIVMDEDTYFIEPMRLFTSLWNIPNIRLIVLNNRRILVNIYDKHERSIADPGQLINAIGVDNDVFNID